MNLRAKISVIYHKVNQCVKQYIYNKKLKTGRLLEAKIQRPEVDGVKVCVFSPHTREKFEMPPVLDFIRGTFEIDYPEIALWKFHDSMIFFKSDVVLTKDGNAVWPKYFKYNYNHNITYDRITGITPDGLCEHQGILCLKNPRRVTEIDVAFSMIGVCDNIWAHALVEYLPKLGVLEDAIKDSEKKITLIIPEYTDNQLKEIVNGILKKYNVNIYQISEDEAIKAKVLYFIERPTTFTDHEVSVSVGDSTIPKATANFVKKEIVEPLQSGITVNSSYKRLFLARRGGFGKGLLNGDEVEKYFENLGFLFVEPHKLSLKEKITMFMSADYIVGPGGSAFTNLIFCRPGTKVIKFCNFQRQFEDYMCLPIQHFGVDLICVTGRDDKASINPSHCSYYIPMDSIKEACEYHGII